MAVFYITQWRGIREQGGGIQAPYGKIAKTTLAIGAEAHTDILDPECRVVEMACDAICSYVAEKNAVATTSDMRLPADTHSKFQCVNGGVDRVSVIANT